MQRASKLSCIALVVVLIGAPSVWGTVQPTINVQGRLTNTAGNPLPAGQKTLIFKIFDREVAGREVWPEVGNQEQHIVTTAADGLFSAELGTSYPISDGVFFGPERWLEVYVDDGDGNRVTMPRIRMTSNAWSFRTSTIDEATGGDVYGNMRLHSDLFVGEAGDPGAVHVRDNSGTISAKIDGATGNLEATGLVRLLDAVGGTPAIELATQGLAGNGVLRINNGNGNRTVNIGTPTNESSGFGTFHMDGSIWGGALIDGWDGNSGRLSLYRPNGGGFSTMVELDGDDGGGATLALRDGTRTTVWMDADAGGGGGGLLMYNSLGNNTIELDADEGADVGVFRLLNATAQTRVRLHAAGAFDGGELLLLDTDGNTTVDIQAAESLTNGAQIQLRKADGTTTITLDAEQGEGGTGRIITPVLQITGGSDLSENFAVRGHDGVAIPAPGMVVCLDPLSPGALIVSAQPYDRKVAGIVSGAGGINTGMLMGQTDSEADGLYPVALTGRVYVKSDASQGPISVGDLLTTSSVPGHAMSAGDYQRARGAIIGKAMSNLESGRGLVLVLVGLQ